MKIANVKEFTKDNKSWIVGNFDPSFFKTENFEFGIHKHLAKEQGIPHYHKLSNEITIILKGSMTVNGKELKSGDMFMIEPYMVSESVFHEDTTLLVLRDKSIPSDKIEFK